MDSRDQQNNQQDPWITANPIVNIIGERVALGPQRRDLLPLYQCWSNDFSSARTLGLLAPMTLEQEMDWYDRVMTSSQHSAFIIYEIASWRPIGTTELMDIDYRNRRAKFGILIGESGCRGKGYGTEATQLMLDYAFTALGLHNVMLRVFAYNLAGIRAYEKAGFREFGRRHQCFLMGGRLWDEVYMECLATDFASPVLKRVLVPDEERS